MVSESADVTVLQWARTGMFALTTGKWPPDLTDAGVQGFTSHWEFREKIGRGEVARVTRRPEKAEADFEKQEWHYVAKDITETWKRKYGC
jgi:hypothetical protein